jgi:thymidylate synthase (FAD)
MQFVKPVAVIHTAHNLKGGLQLAEFAGRLCYKSEDKIKPGSYVKFLLMLIDKGHTSILEHCPIYVCGYHDMMSIEMINIRHSAFSRFVSDIKDARPDSHFYYIYTNLRVVYNESPELAKALIQTSTMEDDEIWKAHGVAWFVPKFDHPFARMSAYITTLRSVVDELVREHVQSDAVESTRWCDYSNDSKFNGVTFCLPHWVNSNVFDNAINNFIKLIKEVDDSLSKINKLQAYYSRAYVL